MRKVKACLVAAMVIAAGLVVGCASYAPVASQLNFPADGTKYVILGRVTVKNGGYTNLIKEAQKIYPDADDVVNIYMDQKSGDTVLSGIAIKYNKE